MHMYMHVLASRQHGSRVYWIKWQLVQAINALRWQVFWLSGSLVVYIAMKVWQTSPLALSRKCASCLILLGIPLVVILGCTLRNQLSIYCKTGCHGSWSNWWGFIPATSSRRILKMLGVSVTKLGWDWSQSSWSNLLADNVFGLGPY